MSIKLLFFLLIFDNNKISNTLLVYVVVIFNFFFIMFKICLSFFKLSKIEGITILSVGYSLYQSKNS